MPATRNIMSSALFAMPYISYQPVNISNNEPALQAANLTKQTIMAPPFRWHWNRGSFHVDMNQLANRWPQGYTVPLSDFHFIEKLWLTDPENKVTEIVNIVSSLADESVIKRPSSASVNFMDTDGTLTIKLNTLPDVAYSIDGYYQRAPVLMTSLANSWAPIPDFLAYVYDWGFLAFVALITKDARAPLFLQKFASHILTAQDGLTATQRNIFLGNFLPLITEQQRDTISTQQGVQARGNV
jgi:hypothetical protein